MSKIEALDEERRIHFRLVLWGCSLAFIESVVRGAQERGAEVTEYVCPAYAGVDAHIEEEKAPQLRTYLRRMENLAQKPLKDAIKLERENEQRMLQKEQAT